MPSCVATRTRRRRTTTAGTEPTCQPIPYGGNANTMLRWRSLLWLVALLAFLAPSLGTPAMAGGGLPAQERAAADCPEHAPPPSDPCPAKDTAKHAAGECCPSMTGSLAVLPSADDIARPTALDPPAPALGPSLAGLDLTKDPPPPRA